ncbi:uncharacterized protein A4U43_C03F23140 [Asparagus officinalis]|uniref:Protein PHLOEM PROTEIN 2-LIKE A10 n=1 Tax=Asparagus officinalis TaxID=4686 RepID=A0A5P1FDA2_ASPOF|nr:protein PHLOEM PROTEIN 2-LIKE A10 [Asparagus officinalis]ONK76034.1 uncharacterized protein A4U43_C03F23140 [Asparagus officinalis]
MSLDLLRRRRKHLLFIAAAGVSFYGAYKLYHHPSISSKRNKLASLLKTIISVSDAVTSSADTVNLLLTDLNGFLRSNSDEIPNSLKQISKLARSDDFSGSICRFSEALTVGLSKGFGSVSGPESGPGFSDKLLDKLFSNAGSGFVSIVAGSFAKNLVLGFYSTGDQSDETSSSSGSKWIDLICDDKCRDTIAECIRVFVSNAVAVYLDKTMEVNTYDEFFSGLTNPRHEVKVKDFLVSVCNGAVETLVKTSHQVLTTSNQEDQTLPRRGGSSDERIKEIGRWVNQVSSTMAVPRNRRLVLDVTGRVTFETVKSFLEFVMLKTYDGVKRASNIVHEEVIERGFEVMRYVSARSMLIVTICFALCMHVMAGIKILDTNVTQHLVLLQ